VRLSPAKRKYRMQAPALTPNFMHDR